MCFLTYQQENQGSHRSGTKGAWQTPPATMTLGRNPSPSPSDSSVQNGKLGRLRGSVAGNLASHLRSSNSADGRIHGETEPPSAGVTKRR